MAYTLGLRDPVTGETAALSGAPRFLRGSEVVVGGGPYARITLTHNYSPHFRRLLGHRGLWILEGMTGERSQQLLSCAIAAIKGEPSGDYWASTEGNAKAALEALLTLARAVPDGVWQGD